MRPQTFTDVPSTRKPSSLILRLQAGADEPRPNIGGIQKNHPNPAQPCANSSKRCIKRASCAGLRLVCQADRGYHGRRMLSSRGQEADGCRYRAVVAPRLAQVAPDRIDFDDSAPTTPERKGHSSIVAVGAPQSGPTALGVDCACAAVLFHASRSRPRLRVTWSRQACQSSPACHLRQIRLVPWRRT